MPSPAELAYLRASGVPEEGTPERAAWDLVTAWWQDTPGERAPTVLVGQVIAVRYPELQRRIAALLREHGA